MGNSTLASFLESNVVCPPHLPRNSFVTCAVDNIDHNPGSTTVEGSFHGTAISINTHLDSMVMPQTVNHSSANSGTKKLLPLPESYTVIKPTFLNDSLIAIPDLKVSLGTPTKTYISNAQVIEKSWFETVANVAKDDCPIENVSWAAYHANRLKDVVVCKGVSGMLPLFEETADSPAMVSHAIKLISAATEYLNPGQVPVLACDQPLFAIAKKCQWAFPSLYGEDKLVLLFGGLHIEINLFRCIGNFLEGSGWVEMITEAGIATSGTAESFLNCTHVAKTRRAHQITAAVLYMLRRLAYKNYLKEDFETYLTEEKWIQQKCQQNVNFLYWNSVLEFEQEILLFIRSIRERDFRLYVEILDTLMPWFFALNHPHYSRFLSAHVRDMKQLPLTHPSVYENFMKGNFTFNKTCNPFSSLAIDHNHEQHNAVLKGDGGVIGILENESALLRWMVSGPEISRILRSFEDTYLSTASTIHVHHEQTNSVQMLFVKEVKSLLQCFIDNGNPFEEECTDPKTLKSKIIFDEKSRISIEQCKIVGEQQYNAFVKERFVDKTVGIMETINSNSLPLFREIKKRKGSKTNAKMKLLKNDCELFSRLFIAAQNRAADLNEFFKYENQPFPPAFSENGSIRSGKKSDILVPLESMYHTTNHSLQPNTTCSILDGPAIPNFIKKGASKTFGQYADQKFVPYIKHQYGNQIRIDLIFDVYIRDSLKAHTRQERGSGMRQKVLSNINMPKNWETFLRVNENKKELFNFLALETVEKCSDGNQLVICTVGETCISNKVTDLSRVSPCDHEEADSRIMVHLNDAVVQGHSQITIRTVDSDVVVIAVSKCTSIDKLQELWIAFGTGKDFRYIAAHELGNALGPDRSFVLPFVHAFSGCDVIETFFGRGKKRTWDVWKAEDNFEYTNCFARIITNKSFDDNDMKIIQKFVVQLYDRSCGIEYVNEARKYLFAVKLRPMNAIPPTEHALLEHLKRTMFQATFIWCRSSEKILDLPSPTEYGWTKVDGGYEPYWTTLPEIAESCNHLVKCGCTKGCKGRCKCKEKTLPCTSMCLCQGLCVKD